MLRFIRSALHMLFLTVTVIPWSLTVVALSPFVSKQWLYGFCHVWVRMVVASARPLLGIRTRVRGLENLPAGRRWPPPCCSSSISQPGKPSCCPR